MKINVHNYVLVLIFIPCPFLCIVLLLFGAYRWASVIFASRSAHVLAIDVALLTSITIAT